MDKTMTKPENGDKHVGNRAMGRESHAENKAVDKAGCAENKAVDKAGRAENKAVDKAGCTENKAVDKAGCAENEAMDKAGCTENKAADKAGCAENEAVGRGRHIAKNPTDMDAPAAQKVGYKDVFHQREYLKIILASLINRFGDSVDAIAFTWLVYAITGSAAWSAIIAAVNQLPSVLVQPFAGALVEGMKKKRLMVVTDIIRGSLTAGIALLYVTGGLNPWLLLGFTLINSTAEAFRLPAGMAVTPLVLEKKYYEYGTSLHSALCSAMELIGLGAAGMIIGIFGIGTAIAIDGISFFGSAWILSFLRAEENGLARKRLQAKTYIKTLRSGLQYLKGQPVIRNFCLMAAFINLAFTPLNSLQMPLIQDVLGQGSELLSAFSIAFTIGMGAGAFAFPFLSQRLPIRAQVIGFGLLTGAGLYGIVLPGDWDSPAAIVYAMTLANAFLIGFSTGFLSSTLRVQFLKAVRQEYLARVAAIFNAGASAATPVGAFLVSGLTAVCPVADIIRFSGIFCCLVYLAIALLRVRLE